MQIIGKALDMNAFILSFRLYKQGFGRRFLLRLFLDWGISYTASRKKADTSFFGENALVKHRLA